MGDVAKSPTRHRYIRPRSDIAPPTSNRKVFGVSPERILASPRSHRWECRQVAADLTSTIVHTLGMSPNRHRYIRPRSDIDPPTSRRKVFGVSQEPYIGGVAKSPQISRQPLSTHWGRRQVATAISDLGGYRSADVQT